MNTDASSKTLGAAIDGLITALDGLDSTDQLTAIRAACEHLGVPLGSNPQQTASAPTVAGSPPQASGPSQATFSTDIRALKAQKDPTTATEMACLVAYYLKDLAPPEERKDTVTASDLDKYFRQASFRLPKAKDQLPFNVKNAGYFESAGSGAFRLNAVGYNLVAHSLPRADKRQSDGPGPAKRGKSKRKGGQAVQNGMRK